jgi:hypothetical protein
MHPDAPYFSILLCLMPDDFTRQVESAATQWAKQPFNVDFLCMWLASMKYAKYAHLVADVVAYEFYECFSFQKNTNVHIISIV